MTTPEFATFLSSLIGMPVSHVWRGYGSALFLEFGNLRPTARRDDSDGNPEGEMSLMVEWSWRIEGRRSILCGSWSDEPKWPRAFALLRNTTVAGATLFGRLPEIELRLANDVRVLSFMTAEGSPAWALIDRRGDAPRSLYFRRSTLFIESTRGMPTTKTRDC